MTDYIAISKRIASDKNQKVLKSNLKQIINTKYNMKGWRKEVAGLLNMNINTFSGMVNQANNSNVSLEKLMYIVDTLQLDMKEVLADNKVIVSNQGRYGNDRETKKWTEDRQIEFIADYINNNNIKYLANKYKLSEQSVRSYYKLFKKKVRTYE